ncbi:phosphohydrolase [bacterium SM23_57]|nr:MAG: phosphohydrolase [bacterium SM23_57]
MDRNTAYELVQTHVKNKNLRKHMIAVEAVMKELAKRLGEDEEQWGLAGLLHDLDYDQTVDDFPRHGFVTEELLEPYDMDPALIHAIKAHAGHAPRNSTMDKAIYAADPITGLVVAAVLMHPSKKLEHMDVGFLKKRFKEKRFAAGADRDQIRSCSEFGMDLDDFLELSLKAMQGVAKDLGF